MWTQWIPGSLNFVLVFIAIFVWLAYHLQKTYSYWSDRGVPYIRPLPLVGNIGPSLFIKKWPSAIFTDFYRAKEGARLVGFYQLTKPTLLIRDPELVREVLIKNFSCFPDRIKTSTQDVHNMDLMTANLFQVGGQRWRNMRYKMAPAFTASKLKSMYDHLLNCTRELEARLAHEVHAGNGEVEVKNLMSNYTMDAIAACALGLKCNTIRDNESNFKRIVARFLCFDRRAAFINILMLVNNKLVKFLNLSIMREDVQDFFKSVTKDAINLKTAQNYSNQKDLLQHMVTVRDTELKGREGEVSERTPSNGIDTKKKTVDIAEDKEDILFTNTVIAANAAIFLAAGFEPTASTLVFTLYELALNPDIQERVLKEMQSVQAANKGEITYEALKKLTYADCVLNEVLRKYPIVGHLVRMCTEPLRFSGENFTVEKNCFLIIPTYALQRDPKYFPNPDKFDPDRFNEANKDKIVPGTYSPFGDGPRFCIAKRLALLEIKAMMVAVVTKYMLKPSEKTQLELKYDPYKFTLSPAEDLWIRFEKRSK